ncbi:NADH:ubiquinone oxidoreductase subunit ASHI [Leptinotarsa decemlineata]|uniref:NADH:ubiquinone oxidoreductase subunit ASHI n=1 Tax=Leptinotarsa decemlineata TaxID=7539 RepID=UPI003D303F1E
MNSLMKGLKPPNTWMKNNTVLVTAIRNHWNKDYKPGPYPKTEAERLAAAKKYNLLPEEYEPYPDDGQGLGDYPKLPMISVDAKDPFYPWDYPELKRNFNEPVHAEYDLIRADRYDWSLKLQKPLWYYWAQFLGFMFGTYAIYAIMENFKMFHATVPPQYPKEGKKYYTFEKE